MRLIVIIAIATVLLFIPSNIDAQQLSISISGNPKPIEYSSIEFIVNFDGELYNGGKIYSGVYEKDSSNKSSIMTILTEDTKTWNKTIHLGTFYDAGKTYIFEIKNGNIIEQFEFTVQDKVESTTYGSIVTKKLTAIFDKCEDDLWIGHFEDKKTGERIKVGKVFLYDEKGLRTKTTSLFPPEGDLKIFPKGNEQYPEIYFATLRVESYEDLSFSPICPIINEIEIPTYETQISQSTPEIQSAPLMIANEHDEIGASIKSMNSYVDEYGTAHIIGEFVNNQDKTLNFVKFIATLYDISGNVLDTEFTYSTIDIVSPFTKTPFEITVTGDVGRINNYEVQSSGVETLPLPQKLELSTVRIFEDEYGTFHIVGEVFNKGDSTANFVKVVSNFYDSNDEIVGIGWTYTIIDSIYPNGKSPFEITISEFISNNGYSFQKPFESFSIFVQSSEYGLMYDLPTNSEQTENDINNELTLLELSEQEITSIDDKELSEEQIRGTDTENREDSGGGCLIATATYGSELAPEVQKLRELRDTSLLSTTSGTNFMSLFNDVYYSFSPVIADYERENPYFKEMVKLAITPMITSLSILNYVDMNSEESVLGYGISLILLNGMMYVGIPIVAIVGIRKRF